jgi:ribosome biogenesis protein Nip4
MYRPPLRGQNSSIENNFFNDFSTLAEQLATAPGRLAIVGDLNLHMDDSCNVNAKKFHDILESFNLKQHVSSPTHNRGHILDLIITRAEDCLVSDIVVKHPVLSDHLAVHCKLKLKKLPAERREVSFRKLKSININSMREDLKSSTVIMDAYTDLSGLINTYEHEFKHILDTHAPKKSRMITIRPLASWYGNSINVEKKKRRKFERRWRKSRSVSHRELYEEQCKLVNSMIKTVKTNYYSNIIIANKGDQKVLFNTIDNLLHRNVVKNYPKASSAQELANTFADFFHHKIENIKNKLSAQNTAVTNPYPDVGECSTEFTEFQLMSEIQIKNFVDSSCHKSCSLDPLPASILKSCTDILLPVITRIVNTSLVTATMPTELKNAVLTPNLKKTSLDHEVYSNFRPISDLKFISKIVKKSVSHQLTDYLRGNDLEDRFQSAYKGFHSTETAVVKVHNDIVSAIGTCNSGTA